MVSRKWAIKCRFSSMSTNNGQLCRLNADVRSECTLCIKWLLYVFLRIAISCNSLSSLNSHQVYFDRCPVLFTLFLFALIRYLVFSYEDTHIVQAGDMWHENYAFDSTFSVVILSAANRTSIPTVS